MAAAIVAGCDSRGDDEASSLQVTAPTTSPGVTAGNETDDSDAATTEMESETSDGSDAAAAEMESGVEVASSNDQRITTELSTTTTTLIPNTTIEPGDITETVPAQVQEIAPPAAIDQAVESKSGVTARIVQIESIETEARLPGEIAGPGVAITVELANGSSQPIDIGNVVVDLVQADDTSATPISTGTKEFGGDLASGDAATATYVFTIDDSLRSDVTILITYSADEPIVVFTGDIA